MTFFLNSIYSVIININIKNFQTKKTKTLLYAFFWVIPRTGSYPEESIQHSEQRESLKSRKKTFLQKRWNAPKEVHFMFQINLLTNFTYTPTNSKFLFLSRSQLFS